MDFERTGQNVRGFRDLLIWNRGIELTDQIFHLTQDFPRHELYRLIGQLNRASSSVPMNIAEGSGRASTGEYIQSLGHARGSLYEVLTLVEIARRRGYLELATADQLQDSCDEIGRMITGLMRKLAETKPKGRAQITP